MLGESFIKTLLSLVGRQPGFQSQLASNPGSQMAFNSLYNIPTSAGSGGLAGVSDPQAIRNIRADASSDPQTRAMLRAGTDPEEAVSMQLGGGVDDQLFQQGFQQGALQPLISTPIPVPDDPYSSAAGLSNLMKPNVYTDVNAYNQRIPLGPPVDTQVLQAAQNFANPSVFSYNGAGGGLSGMMPSGAPGSMNPMAGNQNQAFGQGQQQQQVMPIQPYTMGT
mgnify:CR=1 FL=1|tara:strand:- start:92 stop:757 length:666 start_codon:yes stop_codon:yes gene_type:complete